MKSILKKSGVLAATLAGVSFASSAFAAEGDAKPEKARKDRFAQTDANSDGKVDLTEFKTQAAKSKKEPKPTEEQVEKNFKRLDKDSNGDLNKEEMAAGKGKKGAKKGEKKAE